MGNHRREYSNEFKREALALIESGRSLASVAEELGISTSSLHRWRKEGIGSTPEARKHDLEVENARLRRKLQRAEREREILKKSIALFVQTGS